MPLRSLATEPVGRTATVQRVVAPGHAPEWALRLAEIGFLPGEPVMVTGRGLPGGEPLAVRIGASTFALRRAEAACIQLHALPDPALPEQP
jgi:ferrous iron transport protein A